MTIVASTAMSACTSGARNPERPAPVSDNAGSSTTADSRPLVASLSPTNATGNRILGSVRLTPTSAGQYRADIEIRNGGGVQNKYPWIVRAGQCGEKTTPPLGLEAGYRLLETLGDGTARISTPVNITIPDGVHHVEILRSPGDRETVVSCGVLSPMS